jgi:hypothetical protein
MPHRHRRVLLPVLFLAGFLGQDLSFVHAQAKPKDAIPLWSLDVKARVGGVPEWDKARKLGIEIIKDENSGDLIYLSETGHRAVVPAGNAAKPSAVKEPILMWGLNLKGRAAGIDDWDKARKFGIDVWKDPHNDNLIYVCETGAIAVVPGAKVTRPEKYKDATRLYDIDLPARPANTASWEKARKFGHEVYKDENAGNLVYLSETGAIAVVPGAGVAKPEKSKGSNWLYDLDLPTRPAGIAEFEKGRKFGNEVHKDENTGNLVYLSEIGAIAVVPGGSVTKPVTAKTPTRLWDLDLKVRPFGSDDWNKARKFGNEIFRDENAGNLIYIGETGALAVVPGK